MARLRLRAPAKKQDHSCLGVLHLLHLPNNILQLPYFCCGCYWSQWFTGEVTQIQVKWWLLGGICTRVLAQHSTKTHCCWWKISVFRSNLLIPNAPSMEYFTNIYHNNITSVGRSIYQRWGQKKSVHGCSWLHCLEFRYSLASPGSIEPLNIPLSHLIVLYQLVDRFPYYG